MGSARVTGGRNADKGEVDDALDRIELEGELSEAQE
jgi:phage terminase small subunit